MRKFVAATMVGAAAAIAVGGVLFGAGCAMGGSPGFYFDKSGIHVKEKTEVASGEDHVLEYTELKSVKNLDIRLENADLEIVRGTEWAVEYVLDGDRTEPVYETDGRTLKIREGEYRSESFGYGFSFGPSWWDVDAGRNRAPYVRITMPGTGALEQVTIENAYGDISIGDKLTAEDVRIYAECGNVEMADWEGVNLTVEEAYGNFTAGKLEGTNLVVTSESGEVKTGALLTETADFQMEYGNLTATVEKVSSLEVENESGAVTLGLTGGMDGFGISLYTDWGTIRTPEGIVEADEMEGSSEFVRLKDKESGAAIRIHTEYGDIRLREEA